MVYIEIYITKLNLLLKVDNQETSARTPQKDYRQLQEAQTTFDIQSYENKVTIALGDNSGDYTLSQRSDALISGNR